MMLALIPTTMNIISMLLILIPVVGLYASYKLWRWQRAYKSRFLWGLFVASIVSDIASFIVGGVALLRQMVPDTEPLPPLAGLSLGVALVLLEIVFFYLVIKWRDLDSYIGEVEGETQDQREDRQFGEQRRELEQKHRDEE